jgi:hypothetical protein
MDGFAMVDRDPESRISSHCMASPFVDELSQPVLIVNSLGDVTVSESTAGCSLGLHPRFVENYFENSRIFDDRIHGCAPFFAFMCLQMQNFRGSV